MSEKMKTTMAKRKHDDNLVLEEPKSKITCKFCSLTFNEKKNLNIHIKRKHTHDFKIYCEICGIGFYRKDHLQTHILNYHVNNLCEYCGTIVNNGKNGLQTHIKENHQQQEKIRTRVAEEDELASREFLQDDINEETAFNKTLLTKNWKIRGSKDPLTLMSGYKKNITNYLISLLKKSPHKIHFVMEITMVKKNREGTHQRVVAYFRSLIKTMLTSSQINGIIEDASRQINSAIENYTQKGSGWIIESIDNLKLYTAIYQPVRGSTYVPTPLSIASKKAIINIRNNDLRCFEYSIIASRYYSLMNQKIAHRPSQYKKWLGKYNFEGCRQPMQLDDISKFEKNNDLAINVYHIQHNGTLISPLRITQKEVRLEEFINLLLIESPDRTHYVWIRNLDKLLRYSDHDYQFCPFCCQGFDKRYSKSLSEHILLCRKYGGQKVLIPAKGKNIVEFNDLHKW